MSSLESKLEAWLRYVAKQEEAIKSTGEAAEAPEDAAKPAPPQPAAYTPAPAQSGPASTPTLARDASEPEPIPAATATITRAPAPTPADLVPEPVIPEVEDFVPITRRRVGPSAIPEAPVPIPPEPTQEAEQKPAPAPTVIARPAAPMSVASAPPAPPAPTIPAPAQPQVRPAVPPEPSLFTPASAPSAPVAPAPPKAPERSPRPARLDNKPVQPPAPMAGEGAQEMWDRLPKHVQLLVGMHPSEVAQRSYKRFKESRDELIQRLLDPTISLEETARILNVCPTTVRRYTNRGSLKHLRTAGNQRRFRLSDVLVFMESLSSKKTEAE